MIVAQFVTKRPGQSDTRTYEDFYKFMGNQSHKLGVMARLYPDNTTAYITEAVGNLIYNEANRKNPYQRIDMLSFEWDLETNYIKRVEFAEVPIGIGEHGNEIIVTFKENYYNAQDIIMIEGSRQQLYILTNADRRSDAHFEHRARIIDTDYQSLLDVDYCQPGMTTRFQSNAVPELSEHGYTKYQSNIEIHKNWITTHRCDIDFSSLYAMTENTFVKISEGENSKALKDTYFQMTKKEKTLFDTFMYVKNNGALFNRSNIDKNGKPTISEPNSGRPIYIGDGLIPQVERFASKFSFTTLNDKLLIAAIQQMIEKAESPTGNNFMFICNERMWSLVQEALAAYLQRWRTCASFIWSQAKNGYVHAGATFQSFEYAGNVITFKVDRALTREFGDKGYALFLDLTPDKSTGRPAIQSFTIKQGEFISSKYPGVGGESGVDSGLVSSTVAGTKLIVMGYNGIGVFNPYRSCIFTEN